MECWINDHPSPNTPAIHYSNNPLSLKMKVTCYFLAIYLNIVVAFNVFAAKPFEIYDLNFQGDLVSYHAEDLNNDGLKDILMFLNRSENLTKERWVSIFLQTEEGFFKKANQTFKMPDQIILFDIGNVDSDPEKEFVYFTRKGIYYYNYEKDGFELEAHKLLQTGSIFMLGNKQTFSRWDFVTDLNGDGIDEVMVPQFTTFVIYFRNPENNKWLKNEISLGPEPKVSGHFAPRFSVGHKANALYSTPYLVFEDFNADDRTDIIGVYQDSLVIACQGEDGFFSNCHPAIPIDFGEIWKGAKIQRTHLGDESIKKYLVRITDLNNDGMLDAVTVRTSTRESIMNPKSEIQIHFGKKASSNSTDGLYFSKEPDQTIRPGGSHLVLDILDLNQDKRLDLLIPVIKVGFKNILNILFSKKIEFNSEAYLLQENGRYPEKPDFKRKLVMKINYRGGPASPVYEIEDFNGDGFLDILTSLEERTLIIFWGDKKKVIKSTVGKKLNIILPHDGERVKAIHLNDDDKCDIIINYAEESPKTDKLAKTVRILLAK